MLKDHNLSTYSLGNLTGSAAPSSVMGHMFGLQMDTDNPAKKRDMAVQV